MWLMRVRRCFMAQRVRAGTADVMADAAAQLPPDAWQNLVIWTTGQQTPAEMVARSRLAEVLLHHVDLGIGFGPGSWPTRSSARCSRSSSGP